MKKVYLRDRNGHPVTLIAYEVADGVITYGMSTCHPKDVFDRAKGHLIAENRMKSRKAHTVYQRHEPPIVDIATDIQRHGTWTGRVETLWCGAAKYYLEKVAYAPPLNPLGKLQSMPVVQELNWAASRTPVNDEG